jgi:ectoine hydroxylase-related dioxygenase (phytanoyl-CoA dioxygenase family)
LCSLRARSHRWNLLPITGLADDMHAIQSVLTPDQRDQFKPVPIELKAGECSFHHPLMVHGSFENRSESPAAWGSHKRVSRWSMFRVE